MCDRGNANACEIVYDLQLEVERLNEIIEGLKPKKVEIVDTFDYDAFASAWGRY